MKNIMGIINLRDDNNYLTELTHHRPLVAVPIAGRYRIIDFVLSNMVNSGISNVGILTENKGSSLAGHLGSGKDWDLDRKRDGLFLLHPDYSQYPMGNHKWDFRHFSSHLEYINYSRQKYVIIASGNVICNIDYTEAVAFHQKNHADITVLYKECSEQEKSDFDNCTTIDMKKDGRVVDMHMSPGKARGNKVAMEIYIMEKSLLIDLINTCIARGEYDMVKDGIIKNLANLKIYGYPYQGYLAKINSVQSYYKHSLDLIKPEIWKELFFNPGLIYTKIKDTAPAKYSEYTDVKNSLVANDCVIEGKVENSILFRGVKVGKGTVVKNSIIMAKCIIDENVILENVISDKETYITKEKRLKGEHNYPMVIRKKSVI